MLGVMDFVLFLTDYVVSGRFLGEEALSGLTVVNPLITFMTFVNIIIPASSSVAISYARGKGEKDRADKIFGQGIVISALAGLFWSVLLFALSSRIWDTAFISGEVTGHAVQYCRGLILMPFFMFLNTFLYYIHIGEGFEKVCVASSMAKLAVNISLDIVFCSIWGTYGVGIATTLGYMASLMVKLVPVFHKRFGLRFKPCADLKYLARAMTEGTILSADYICPVLFAAIMNMAVMIRLGERGLVIFSIILNIESLVMSLYSCLANSVQSVICQYHVEKNFIHLRRVMAYMMKYLVLISCLMSAFFIALAPMIPGFFGVNDSEAVKDTILAIRFYVPFVVFLGITTMLSRYYVCIRHRVYGFLLICFSSIGFPVIAQWVMGIIWGGKGVWLGLGSGYLLAFLVNFLCVRKIRDAMKGEYDPVLLFDTEAEKRQLSYDLKAVRNDIMDCVYDIDTKLAMIEGLNPARRNKIVLMAEENCMNILDKNPDNPADIEISIIRPADVRKQITLSIRSNSELTDLTADTDLIASFREYVLANVMVVSRDSFFVSRKSETLVSFKC